jgi:ATP-binding cassette subfamily C protein
MFGDPVLLVLDEPNANLDAEGEAALVQAVDNARNRVARPLWWWHIGQARLPPSIRC